MTIRLPEHLQRYVHDQVLAGRFRTEDDVILDALERHRQAQQPPAASLPTHDPVLGCMRADAELMDEIVADTYRHRREATRREIDLKEARRALAEVAEQGAIPWEEAKKELGL